MTITVRLTTQLENKLRDHLEGRELSEFVREAIAEKLEREAASPRSAYEQGRHLFGRHGSGRGDLSRNRKALLDEILRAKHHR